MSNQPTVAPSRSHLKPAMLTAALACTLLIGFSRGDALAAGPPFEARCSGWLANISTRGQVGTGDGLLIAGFIVQHAPVTVVLRAIGPSLAASGVAGTLADPGIELFQGQTRLAANDDWRSLANADFIASLGLAPADRREAALVITLEPGAYTALVSGAGGSTGVALVEVFQIGRDGELANLATRGLVGGGDGVMIGGFIVKEGPTTLAIRALGPSLAAQGVAGPLVDPVIELYQGQTRIAANDDWQRAYGMGQLTADLGQAPPDARESVIVVRLDPGAYTAVVRGAAGAGGVGMVEVFRVLDRTGPHVDLVEQAAVDVSADKRLVVDGRMGFAIGGSCEVVPGGTSGADCDGTLTTLKLDGPTAPAILGEYVNPDEAIIDVDIHAEHAYVLLYGPGAYYSHYRFRLAIMPLDRLAHMRPTDPPDLAEIASLALTEDPNGEDYYTTQTAIADGRLYRIDRAAITIYSLDAPAVPLEIGRVDVRAPAIEASGARLAALVYGPGTQDPPDDIVIFDVADPAAPARIGGVSDGSQNPLFTRFWLAGERLFAVAKSECSFFPLPNPICTEGYALQVHDISNPGQPRSQATLGNFRNVHGLAAIDDMLYLLDAGVMRAFDLARLEDGPIGEYPLLRDFGSDVPVQRDSATDIAAGGEGLFALVRGAGDVFAVRGLRGMRCEAAAE